MNFLTFNVQSLRDLENKDGKLRGPFPELAFVSRWPRIKKFFDALITVEGTEVFALQEVGPDAEENFREYFQSIGYSCIVSPYCDDKFAFRFILAFKPESYQLHGEVSMLPYTVSGRFLTAEQRKAMTLAEIKDHNLGVEFEKSAQMVTLISQEDQQLIKIYNTHPGLTNEHRIAAMKVLAEKISEDKKQEINMLVAGDMNQFDDRCEEPKILKEQSAALIEAGLNWISKETLLNDGAQATFMAYAFDIMRFLSKEEKGHLFGLYDQAKLLKNSDDLNQLKEVELSIREFFQSKQKLLINSSKKGSGLSTVLDAVFTKGDVFTKKPHEVRPITWYRGGIFNTAAQVSSREAFEQELVTADEPLISDHFALLLKPS